MSSRPSVLDFLERIKSGRTPRSFQPLIKRTGLLVVEIGHEKPSCIACGGKIPKGRHYTCSLRCKRDETLRVKKLAKRRKESQLPRMSIYNKVGDALRGLFE